jgi:hypothetical protein
MISSSHHRLSVDRKRQLHSATELFMEVAMYSEVSGIFNRAERLWRGVFAAETLDRKAGDLKQRDSEEASAKKHRNWTEEDFLWCWQHRGFW